MKIIRLEDVTDFSALDYSEATPEEKAKILALAKDSFTAADLQEYTELDEGVPMEDVLTELEEIRRNAQKKSLS